MADSWPTEVIQGDCLTVLPTLAAGSADAVVTDPPYGIRFMGQAWDGKGIEESARRGAAKCKSLGPCDPGPEGHSGARTKSAYGGGGCEASVAGTYDQSVSGHRAFQVWCEGWAAACLHALKPGGYLLSFGGTRTYHRLTCAIEDAGFEVRDCLMWLYGSGFPKGKGCLKPAWEPIVLARRPGPRVLPLGIEECRVAGQRPDATMEAWEPEANLCGSCASHVASNVRQATPGTKASSAASPAGQITSGKGENPRSGTSKMATGCSVGPCREGPGAGRNGAGSSSTAKSGKTPMDLCPQDSLFTTSTETNSTTVLRTCSLCGEPITTPITTRSAASGRWPSNVAHDGSDEVLEAFAAFGERHPPGSNGRSGVDGVCFGHFGGINQAPSYTDTGTAARFFYTAKASRRERNAGLEGMPEQEVKLPGKQTGFNPKTGQVTDGYTGRRANTHPTVKPLALMRWLVKLVCPEGGLVLDPFAGSGSTGVACVQTDRGFIGIEQDEGHCQIARGRLERARQRRKETLFPEIHLEV